MQTLQHTRYCGIWLDVYGRNRKGQQACQHAGRP